eukprot:CAMPEP_0174376752 /NCGR_PEP_ID=MMETSP0811_2-20130205/119353_1 /TAXON_ID=73025 ORGANISM="Eutreptiella gymnastica-like, Strain CCMP1594" /NCGR_SAMPLE_ID=MMETSP0811_2 /ASSEMBLY_ACC=CAM_ASM_000667 /LENGTH=44 /DNA_ID= /DNA_START= /DNA_END= /DNA_ORIENTATION=
MPPAAAQSPVEAARDGANPQGSTGGQQCNAQRATTTPCQRRLQR